MDKAGKSLFMDLHHLVEGATHVTEAVAALAVGRPQRELLTVGRVVPRPNTGQILTLSLLKFIGSTST